MRRPLVLTGGPAVGKSETARGLAAESKRCAVIEVDDVRQLVVSGARAPWQGPAGAAQALLGARNACALARNFLADGFEVVIADVLTPELCEQYRHDLQGCLIVHLTVTLPEARRRAALRPAWITPAEFDELHRLDQLNPPPGDVRLAVDDLDAAAQRAAVRGCWS